MSFPETRASLIQRLAVDRQAREWSQFHGDYWRPICRFSRWSGGLSEVDAEDVAGQVFEVLLKSDLLARWVQTRTAKLRTLLCSVTRNILSNRRRLCDGRARLVREHGDALDRYRDSEGPSWGDSAEPESVFYAAWACELLKDALEELLSDLQAAGRGDCFRVLYGRVCEGMSIKEVAGALGLSSATVDNYYRSARERLSRKLEERLTTQIERYSHAADLASEFSDEWRRLGDYLTSHGGLEESIRQVSLNLDAGPPAAAGARWNASGP